MTAAVGSIWAPVRARLPLYRKPAILGLSIFGYVLFAWLMLIVPATPGFKSIVGFDSFAYWNVDPFHPYLEPLGGLDSFTYSPAFAQAAAPFHFLPFGLFYALWASFLVVNFVWLTRRMALVWLIFLPIPLELYHGNVHILLATICVLGFEYPALWSIGILTKVTPGIALLWFAVRREWRSLAWALGATVAIAAVSFVVAPGAWFDWIKFLTTSQETGAGPNDWYSFLFPPLWLRVAAAAALIVWGARTDRRWVVPVATCIAMPVFWITTPAILVAIPRLRKKAGPAARTTDSAAPAGLPTAASAAARPALNGAATN